MEKGSIGLRRVHIVNQQCITSLGGDVDVLWTALLAHKHGFKKVQRFPTDGYVNSIAGCIDNLNIVQHGRRFESLLDMLCQKNGSIPSDSHLLGASTKGNIELNEHIAKNPSENNVDAIYPITDYLCKSLNIQGSSYMVNAACASGSAALIWASEMIMNGQADSVVVFAIDIVSEFVFSGFSALKAMSPHICRPFDINRDGLIIGEAAGFVHLMSEERCIRDRRTSYGSISGWGISSDATHITAPDRCACGLQRAIRNALGKASLEKDQIAIINTHGTGTVHNDAMEMTALNVVFGDAMPWIFSVKGSIGHSMGAAGLIEAIITSKALQEQIVPPTTGVQQPESDIRNSICMNAMAYDGRYALSIKSGFGGINTALILEKA